MIALLRTLALMLSCVICVTSETLKGVFFQMRDQNQLPVVFEGIPVDLSCIVDLSKYSSVSWSKDGIEILSFRDRRVVSEKLPNYVTVKTVLTFGNRGFYSIAFTNLTINDHSGLYSCIASAGFEVRDSDSFLLDVKERKPVCVSQKGRAREFLVGESLSLFCHNPLYNPPKVVRWYKVGKESALQTMRTEYDYTSVDNATFVLDPSMNGSSFTCYAVDDEDSVLTGSVDYSCSFGPITIFDSTYVTIDETSSGTNRTFSCRIVPQTNGARIRWTALPTIETFYISTSDYQSTVIFIDLLDSFEVGSYLNVTCEVSLNNGKNFSISKSFSVTSPTESADTPDRNGESFPILPVIIAAGVVVAVVIVIATFVVIFCAITNSRKESTPAPSSSVKSNEYIIAFRKDSSKNKELVRLPDGRLQLRPCISIPEDEIEQELSERSPLSSQGAGDTIYDLPPPSNGGDVPPASPIYANKEIV